jgi:TonB family protein
LPSFDRRGRLAAATFASLIVLLHGCASTPRTIPPRLGPDFPKGDPFYPAAEAHWGVEGAVVVHFCVDASGRLTEPPSVQQFSGRDSLDAAALQYMKAGDGHYLPAYVHGRATPGCAPFTIHFELTPDPRFPTLSRRQSQLFAQLQPGCESVLQQARAVRLQGLRGFDPQNPEHVMTRLRPIVSGWSPIVGQMQVLLSKYVMQADELGRANDVGEAERTAYNQFWQPKRVQMQRALEAMSDLQGLLNTFKELEDYVQSANPPLAGESGAVAPTPRQREQMAAIFQRAQSMFEKVKVELTEVLGPQGPGGAQLAGVPTVRALGANPPRGS